MAEKCDQNCAGCPESTPENIEEKPDFSAKLHQKSNIKKVFGVVSGKGGVGKSLVTSLLAVAMKKRGYYSAVLDADITGSSIPKIFGIREKAAGSKAGIFPVKTKTGIDIMSVNFLMEDASAPVVWRGPLIANLVKQFWSDVIWDNIDYLFIDMPPGTGDVPLTIFQSTAVDGIIVVTSPQELVSEIVAKAVKMAELMDIPIVGLVENMSYFRCPDNGRDYKIFGESHIEELAKEHDLKVLAKLPIDPAISAACDRGMIEFLEGDWLAAAAEVLEQVGEK
ncbi:MAG: Mrp/NBP35 family ATP-binding protein [Firmicutes bacterium]|nr:Mrp/NBP35 family ATP-binding protein [Bacillota bacterium]